MREIVDGPSKKDNNKVNKFKFTEKSNKNLMWFKNYIKKANNRIDILVVRHNPVWRWPGPKYLNKPFSSQNQTFIGLVFL